MRLRSRYTCIRSPPSLANTSVLQRNPTTLLQSLRITRHQPPWSPLPPLSSAALGVAMVAAADPSWQLSHRSAVSGLALFNLALVTFGSLGLAFGAGTTPKYQTVPGPDPLAISGRLRQISGRYYSPDTARNSPPVVHATEAPSPSLEQP